MKEIKDKSELCRIQLDILKHVDAFCKQYNIRYFASGGTMIGAVRHHGYIPWDDDIDIMMLREDYDRFISLYIQNDRSDYKLHYHKYFNGFTFPFVKIDNSRTILLEDVKEPEKDMGVNIDVFPIDVVPENIKMQKRLYSLSFFYCGLINLKNVIPSNDRVWYKNIVLNVSHFLLRPIPMTWLVKQLEKNAIKYKGQESPYCGVVLWGYGMKEINRRENWNSTIDMPFEDMDIPVPKGYDNYLTCVYGDYMKLPPEEKRVSHHTFKAYWKE